MVLAAPPSWIQPLTNLLASANRPSTWPPTRRPINSSIPMSIPIPPTSRHRPLPTMTMRPMRITPEAPLVSRPNITIPPRPEVIHLIPISPGPRRTSQISRRQPIHILSRTYTTMSVSTLHKEHLTAGYNIPLQSGSRFNHPNPVSSQWLQCPLFGISRCKVLRSPFITTNTSGPSPVNPSLIRPSVPLLAPSTGLAQYFFGLKF